VSIFNGFAKLQKEKGGGFAFFLPFRFVNLKKNVGL
jgi:hypothetical protein